MMFDIPNTKAFMDTVHGYIYIPKLFVDNIIDTDWFQRLHNIDQTGMKVLYPNGKHDRFGHSLGVYHLGLKAVDALLNNFKNNKYWNIRSDNTCDIFWSKNKVLFLIACLLHDIGHAPFSHSLENQLLVNSNNVKSSLFTKIKNLERNNEIRFSNFKASAHEMIGALLVINEFKDIVKNILDELKESEYPRRPKINFSEYAREYPYINSSDIDNDICFIARMIIGSKYESHEPEKQIRNCFIELLNGKNFDVDKLDYIIRDTKMSGISNVTIDVERLINSLTLVVLTEYDNYRFENYIIPKTIFIKELKNDGNKIKIDGYLDAKLELHMNCHVIISGDTVFNLKSAQKGSRDFQSQSKLKVDYATEFTKDTVLYDGEKQKTPNDKQATKIVWSETDEEHLLTMKNARLVNGAVFSFTVTSLVFELEIKGGCSIEIDGGSLSIDTAKFNGTIDGECKKLITLGDVLEQKDLVPSPQLYNVFAIGYKKQSINIISNVLDARDYLYLWIYAHHKVVYYANFLLPELSKFVMDYIYEKNPVFPNWRLNYNDIKYLDDCYMLTAMKHILFNDFENIDLNKKTLIEELFSRKYKKSLYKSMAEYDIFFNEFSFEEKNSLKGLLAKLENTSEVKTYGILPRDVIDEINNLASDIPNFAIDSLIWVDSSYSHKTLNISEVYCVFPEETVTMGSLNLLNAQDHFSERKTNHYFYLYYSMKNSEATISNNDVKIVLLNYFKKILGKI